MHGMTLITCTCDRLAGIKLARRWLLAQQLPEPLDVQWLVCDDGKVSAPVEGLADIVDVCNPNLRLSVEHVRRPPVQSVPLSFRGNLAAGLCRARYDRIAIWEDDDYYPPGWLAWLVSQFDAGWELIGEERAKYYNVATRRYRQLSNSGRASLCQTAFTRPAAKWLEQRCRTGGGVMVDIDLWQQFRAAQARLILRPQSTVIGIKGLPGKAGIGMGHRMQGRGDNDLSVLAGWIGEAAAGAYARFYRPDRRAA